MSSIEHPEFDAPEGARQEAQDLLKEHTAWRRLLDDSADMLAKYKQNPIKNEGDAVAFITDVAFKTEKQPEGETTLDKLRSSQQNIRDAAYVTERKIAASNGVDFNPADPDA